MLDLSAIQIVGVMTLVFVGAILQGTIGFAAGVFSIPLMLLTGLELSQAIGVNLITSLVQSSVGVYSLRREIEWRDTLTPLILRWVSLPLGTWALWHVSDLQPGTVKSIIGVLLLTIMATQWFLRIEPREEVHVVWTILAFLSSGFLTGFCGMGGGLMALWVVAHRWNSQRSRGFLFVAFLTTLSPMLLIMLVVFREKIFTAYLLGLMGIPIALLGSWIGFTIGDRLPRIVLQRLIYGVLLVVSIRAVLTPFFQLLTLN